MGNTAYGYSTLALLEIHAKKDYSAIDATYLANANVEGSISDAEIWISGYIGKVWTGTTYNDAGDGSDVPKDITLITNMVANIFLTNWMIEENIGPYADNTAIKTDILEQYDIMLILDKYKDLYSQKQGIYITKHQMSGVDRYSGMYSRPTGW